jgi:hypothetical protein
VAQAQAAVCHLKAVEMGSVRFAKAKLRKLGVDKDLAAQTAGSAYGPWRLANNPVLSFAVPNAYFDSLGIPRLTVADSSTRRTAVYGPVRYGGVTGKADDRLPMSIQPTII